MAIKSSIASFLGRFPPWWAALAFILVLLPRLSWCCCHGCADVLLPGELWKGVSAFSVTTGCMDIELVRPHLLISYFVGFM